MIDNDDGQYCWVMAIYGEEWLLMVNDYYD